MMGKLIDSEAQRHQLVAATPQVIHQPNRHRSRNLFVLKSVGVILALTLLVLVINYYLISNCPKDMDETTGSILSASSTGGGGNLSNQQQQLLHVTTSLRESGGGVVTISVYYEVLCPDSKHFILKQLVPVWNKYKEFVAVRFVPFGKATVGKRGEGFEFSCQHGPEECHGNKLHACVIQAHPTNYTLQMDVIGCSMERFRPWGSTIESITTVVRECVRKHIPGDSGRDVLCEDGDELLAKHGYETLNLRPRVSFIPTIGIDGSLENQRTILRDLDSVVCDALRKKFPANNHLPC